MKWENRRTRSSRHEQLLYSYQGYGPLSPSGSNREHRLQYVAWNRIKSRGWPTKEDNYGHSSSARVVLFSLSLRKLKRKKRFRVFRSSLAPMTTVDWHVLCDVIDLRALCSFDADRSRVHLANSSLDLTGAKGNQLRQLYHTPQCNHEWKETAFVSSLSCDVCSGAMAGTQLSLVIYPARYTAVQVSKMIFQGQSVDRSLLVIHALALVLIGPSEKKDTTVCRSQTKTH